MNIGRIFLFTSATLSSFSAYSEFQMLSDNEMSSMVGQAGLTIDINELNLKAKEVAWRDHGFLAISDIELAGADIGTNANSTLDNIRLTLDVVGASGTDIGNGELAREHLASSTVGTLGGQSISSQVSDGDLIIKLREINPGEGIDFGLNIGGVHLGKSNSVIGEIAAGGGAELVRDLNMTGHIGPVDILINGDEQLTSIDSFFNARGSVQLPFIETSTNFAIHNSRGDSIVGTAGDIDNSFAHLQVSFSQGERSGFSTLQMNVEDFSADIDLTDIQFGDNGKSIGDLYLTDFSYRSETQVYGHAGGISMDIDALNIDIKEIAYKDAGFLAIEGLRYGSNKLFDSDPTNDAFDNSVMYIDVLGEGNGEQPGTPYVYDLPERDRDWHIWKNGVGGPFEMVSGTTMPGVLGYRFLTWVSTSATSSNITEIPFELSDGDLVLNFGVKDPFSHTDLYTPGSTLEPIHAADFGLGIDKVVLGPSTATIGDVSASGGTVLFEDLQMTGYLGPMSIVVDGDTGDTLIAAMFNSQGSVKMPFIATSTEFKMHNSRGESKLGLSSDFDETTTLMHMQVELGQTTNAQGNTALRLDIHDFSGEIDMTNIQFGNNGASIGNIYMTDVSLTAQTQIYGH